MSLKSRNRKKDAMNNNDNGTEGSGLECLHCVLNAAVNIHNAMIYKITRERVNVDDNISQLMEVAAELIAFYDDPKTRKFVMKRCQELLAALVRQKRADGVYPGGHGQNPLPEHPWLTEH